MSRTAHYENEQVPELRQRAHDLWAQVDKMDQANLDLKRQITALKDRRREHMQQRNAVALEADAAMKEWERHNSRGTVTVGLPG